MKISARWLWPIAYVGVQTVYFAAKVGGGAAFTVFCLLSVGVYLGYIARMGDERPEAPE